MLRERTPGEPTNGPATGCEVNQLQALVTDVAQASSDLALDALIAMAGSAVHPGDLTAFASSVQSLAAEATGATEQMATFGGRSDESDDNVPGNLRDLGEAVQGMNIATGQVVAELVERSDGLTSDVIQSLSERSAALRADADGVLTRAQSS